MKLEKGKHFITYSDWSIGNGDHFMLLFEGDDYIGYFRDGKLDSISTEKYEKISNRDAYNSSTKLPSVKFNSLKFLNLEIGGFNYCADIYNIDDYPKEKILTLKKKDIEKDRYLYKGLIHYYSKTDLEFKIKIYEKNWIYNNEFFYDRTEPDLPPVKFKKEELKRLLDCKQFTSSAYVMGGSQMQKQNALNHLLKTQDLTDDLFDAILEKYKDDEKMLTSTISFVIKSNKVKTTSEVNKFLAEKIVYNDSLHELVRTYKKKFGTDDVEDDCVKLLLECIE